VFDLPIYKVTYPGSASESRADMEEMRTM